MSNNNNGEPSSAPQADRWYELKLGSSFKDNPSSKFCTLRYEFKPASIDKTQPGLLHKNKENRVTVDFHNNQPGKPKVCFEGSSEDYKENDAVLFFDGESFRLERLHRAVKRLRHVRLPGESSGSGMAFAGNLESKSPQIGKLSRTPPVSKSLAPSVNVEVERIDIGETERFDISEQERINIGEPESPGLNLNNRSMDYNSGPKSNLSQFSSPKQDDPEENFDIDIDIGDEAAAPTKTGINGGQMGAPYLGVDINIQTHDDSDVEIADEDGSDDSAGKAGANAAEILRDQGNAEDDGDSSSSSDSSGSGSSGSASGSRSGSSSCSSDDDSASSAGEIDI